VRREHANQYASKVVDDVELGVTQPLWKCPLKGLGDDLPFIDDFAAAGFVPGSEVATECDRDDRTIQRQQKTTEAIGSGSLVVLPSVLPCLGEAQSTSSADEWPEEIQKAVLRALPSGPGCRNSQVLVLARELKGLPSLADAQAKDLKPYVRRWHKLALPMIATKAFDETWIDFLRAWPRVKFPKGTEPMAVILRAAHALPVPSIGTQFEEPKIRLLVSLCHELQRASGVAVFFLSCRTAGRLLEVNLATAWRYLYLLQQEEIIVAETVGSYQTKQATRWCYLPPLDT
jgi:hypothetical protein